jgi:hypothetical protein
MITVKENKMNNKQFSMILSVLFVIVLISGCVGQVKGPGIHFGSMKYNFGVIEEGKLVNHSFEFTNNGTETLIVSEVHPTCGCTVAGDYDKEVKPGQQGKIPLSFKTSGYDGPVTKTITVKTNVPDKTDLSLTIEGTVKISVSVNPRTLFLGNIERNRTTPITGKIAITNRLPGAIKITEVTVANENAETNLETIKAGFEYSINVTVNPPYKDGQVMGTVLIKTDSKISPEITAQFSYYLEPMVRAFPNPLFVDMEKIANGVAQEITIECNECQNMRIAELTSNNNKVKMTLKEGERGKRYVVVLSFPKDFTFDPDNTFMITFKAKNVPNEPTFSVPVLKM